MSRPGIWSPSEPDPERFCWVDATLCLIPRSGPEPQLLIDDHVRLHFVLNRPPPDPVQRDRAELDKSVEGGEMIRQGPARAAQPRVPVGRSEQAVLAG